MPTHCYVTLHCLQMRVPTNVASSGPQLGFELSAELSWQLLLAIVMLKCCLFTQQRDLVRPSVFQRARGHFGALLAHRFAGEAAYFHRRMASL
jgi:hypothetical protein